MQQPQRMKPVLLFEGSPGWLDLPVTDQEGVRILFKGVLFGQRPQELGLALLRAQGMVDEVLRRCDGHFAIVASGNGRLVAATDPVNSIPLAYRMDGSAILVSGEASRLLRGGDLEQPSPIALLSLGMAGFTIGGDTLVPAISVLPTGGWIEINADGTLARGQYYRYLPKPVEADHASLRDRLADVTLEILEKTAQSLNGRTVVAPLSAGLDSRLIVSGLKEIGYERIICVSYGRRGNHEAEAARRIATHLGLPWHFFENTPGQQAQTFRSQDCGNFCRFADTLQAMPFQQDLAAVRHFRESGLVPPDAVYINGQSGDYIAGNHIPPKLCDAAGASATGGDRRKRLERLLDALIAKHFDLWQVLKTPANLAAIRSRLEEEILRRDFWPEEPINDFSHYEATEFEDRQSKYVIQGQRSYEWLGHDWRLPLWDREYLEFWTSVPLSAKAGQRLYREMLVERNWGGVWGEDWWFPKYVVPRWIRPLRLVAKAAHVLAGRAQWHRFERRWFSWWTDVICNFAIAPYGRVASDTRGFRNGLAWHAEAYLQTKGFGLAERMYRL